MLVAFPPWHYVVSGTAQELQAQPAEEAALADGRLLAGRGPAADVHPERQRESQL